MKRLLTVMVAASLCATGATLADKPRPWASEDSMELTRHCIETLLKWELLECDYIEAEEYRVAISRTPVHSVTTIRLDNPERLAPDYSEYALCQYDRELARIFSVSDYRSWPRRILVLDEGPRGWPFTGLSSDFEELERIAELTETETLSKQQVGSIPKCAGDTKE